MIKGLIFLLSNFVQFFFKSGNEYTLINRLDSIGDYILFRNFLSPLKNSKFIQKRKILFLANVAWRSIYEHYDREFADKVIWVNVERLARNRFYRIYILLRLSTFNIGKIIQPTFSRNHIVDFLLLPLSSAQKITSKGDDLNYLKEVKLFNDRQYDQLVDNIDSNQFEFERNRHFFNYLEPVFSLVDLDLPYRKFHDKEKFVSFFIGSSSPFRQLSIENMKFICMEILNHTKYKITILGGKNEAKKGTILSELSDRITSQCGLTNLIETIDFIGNSSAVLSMDSSGVHIAMATKVPKVFCFSNGNHLFRFIPYPKNYKQMIAYFPPLIQMNMSSHKKILYDSFSRGSTIPIDSIDLKKHIKEIIKEINKI
ncbi:lipopolysaccharide heptosyltransferase family protein [Leptospira noumeaensis]|uniref:Lipopolysaccharide heptosyltransferase family protein n=1 Tax=Leptospira noumeaensis TaxID=2484964 RepID=A0A4R9I1B1_9LEPT|nr:lipopolysaccharide heptosyltransferase family protein [Leptospira noumeaensis]TGK78431.1 lipopolysaccharide heptosyltransferase family protein [Leptospira noumeaensis]